MATSDVTKKAEDLIDEGADKAKQAIGSVSKKVDSSRHAAQEALCEGKDALENAVMCAKDVIRSNPITSVAVVAALAYLWGRIRS
jgi:ElaB/YqjD/DUF883 family membrane-anchored ribosome-binding protein